MMYLNTDREKKNKQTNITQKRKSTYNKRKPS